MIKKICFYIFLFFILILNIFLDTRINNYIFILGKCFGKNINVDIKIYGLICFIFALISILIVIDILLVCRKNTNKIKGINFKKEDRHIWNCKLDE